MTHRLAPLVAMLLTTSLNSGCGERGGTGGALAADAGRGDAGWATALDEALTQAPEGSGDPAVEAARVARAAGTVAERTGELAALSVRSSLGPEVLAARVRSTLGPGWTIAGEGPMLRVVPSPAAARQLRGGRAYDAASRLAAVDGVTDVRPGFVELLNGGEFEAPPAAPMELYTVRPGEPPLLERARHVPGWNLVAARVACPPPGTQHCPSGAASPCRCAWNLTADDGRALRGDGIRVCQFDTGFTDHPEAAGARLRASDGMSLFPGEPDARDRSPTSGLLRLFGHGTSSASTLLSDEGGRDELWPNVTGAAPRALLIPFRLANGVALPGGGFGWVRTLLQLEGPHRFEDAFAAARSRSCDIISISMGTNQLLPSMRDALLRVLDDGTVVVAAAGNVFPAVTYPAAFASTTDVIAVATTDIDHDPWTGTTAGPQVTVSAPGYLVQSAHVERVGGRENYRVGYSTGATHATSQVTGAVALWIQRHGGMDGLRRKLGLAPDERRAIPCVLKRLLSETAFRPPHWDAKPHSPEARGLYGRGVLDAYALVSAPLPSPSQARARCLAQSTALLAPRVLRVEVPASDALEDLGRLLPELDERARTRLLTQVFGVGFDPVSSGAPELIRELASRLALSPALRATLVQEADGATLSPAVRDGLRHDASRAFSAAMAR